MDERQAREMGEALAFLSGDYRDEPWQCVSCRSEKLRERPSDYGADVMTCEDCGARITKYVLANDQERRMKARVRSGVGGRLVDFFNAPKQSAGGALAPEDLPDGWPNLP